MDANIPIAAFINISFTHHYTIISKVKYVEQQNFYIQFTADTKAKVEDLLDFIDTEQLFVRTGKTSLIHCICY